MTVKVDDILTSASIQVHIGAESVSQSCEGELWVRKESLTCRGATRRFDSSGSRHSRKGGAKQKRYRPLAQDVQLPHRFYLPRYPLVFSIRYSGSEIEPEPLFPKKN
jgi:hypothetical protein